MKILKTVGNFKHFGMKMIDLNINIEMMITAAFTADSYRKNMHILTIVKKISHPISKILFFNFSPQMADIPSYAPSSEPSDILASNKT